MISPRTSGELLHLGVSSLPLLGAQHQFRPNISVKVFLAQCLELHRTLLERRPLLVRILGHLRSHVVADDWVQAGYKHKAKISLVSTEI